MAPRLSIRVRSRSLASTTTVSVLCGAGHGDGLRLQRQDHRRQGAQAGDYKGKVLLVVNTASQCGFTPQYKGLEALYKKYKDKGFAVLGFPSNQFGQQEPGPDSEIAEFCEMNYGVTFPMFSKIDVNGDAAHPLFKYLTSDQARAARQRSHQVELHQVPDRQRRQRRRALCADDEARGSGKGHWTSVGA